MTLEFTRRSLIAVAGAGLSVELLATPVFAASDAALQAKKLVVVICRGAMDGLSATPPVADPDYAALRGPIAIPPADQPGGALRLDDTFGLHPKLVAAARLAQAGQMRICPAAATPDRARSHFEAQDVLESGAPAAYGASSGWLNRAVQSLGPARRVQAISVGAEAPLILRGKLQTASWSPGKPLSEDARLIQVLGDLYANDPLLGPALASGLQTESMARTAMGMGPAAAANTAAARSMGETLGRMMTEPGGPSIAAVSLDGFDTHANQGAAEGLLANRLTMLDNAVDGLQSGLGPAWRDTIVVAATEFGRTARVNGTRGTDHGTGSTVLLFGGSLKRGGLVGDWPGLKQQALFENRDLYPAVDMRAVFKGVLAEHLGIDRAALDTVVFPDTAKVAPMQGLVA
jgi:uncharacterized protein (DUF1501 family)